MASQLLCKDLSKNYRDQTVLSGLSFSLEKGEGLLVTGPNGVGKTTLLNILAGLVWSEGGEVRVESQLLNPDQHLVRAKVGFLPANENSLFLNATARENLRFWSQLHGMGAPANQKIETLAETWGFTPYLDRMAREMSSGYRRRVALARALLHEPSLLILDEPFAFLDQDNLDKTLQRLEEWLAVKKGALVVSSNNLNFNRGPNWKSLDL